MCEISAMILGNFTPNRFSSTAISSSELKESMDEAERVRSWDNRWIATILVNLTVWQCHLPELSNDIWVLVHRSRTAFRSHRSIFPHSLEEKKNHAKSRRKLCEHATATQNHAKITLSQNHKNNVLLAHIFLDFNFHTRKSKPCTRKLSKCPMNTRFKQNGSCTITLTSECSLHLHQVDFVKSAIPWVMHMHVV